MAFSHIPVLLGPCLEGLAIRPEGIYVDATAGRRWSFFRDCSMFDHWPPDCFG